MPVPLYFSDETSLVAHLKADGKRILDWGYPRNLRRETAAEVVLESVASNTFRAFHHMPEPPSQVFRLWGIRELSAKGFLEELFSILDRNSQADFDAWNEALASRLATHWAQTMGPGKELSYGPNRKLVDLLLKEMVRWTALDEARRKTMIQLLHVPLDSFSLSCIRNCVGGLHIPSSAAMSFVKDRDTYNHLCTAVSSIAAKAGCAPIVIDFLAWDSTHM